MYFIDKIIIKELKIGFDEDKGVLSISTEISIHPRIKTNHGIEIITDEHLELIEELGFIHKHYRD